jgi:hypothetical protein
MSLASEGKLKAPKGKFRVVGVDTFEGFDADYLIGDYDTIEEARKVCTERGGVMNSCYVYDDSGMQLAEAGSF